MIKCDTCKVNLRASQKRNLPDVQVNTEKSEKIRMHEKETVSNVQAADTEQSIPKYRGGGGGGGGLSSF